MRNKTTTGLRITLYLAMFVLLSSFALSLGLIPASETILIGTDKQEFEINVMNSDNKNYELRIDVQGDLAEYISFDKKTITLPRDKKHETIKAKLNLPENHGLRPGEHTTRIIISNQESGSGEISARISLSFRLTVIIPFEGPYLDVVLFAPNFDKTKGGNFVIQAQNKGSQNAINVIPIVDIYSSTNQRIATLRGEERLIRVGETTNFALPLTEDLENGKYSARASLVYAGASGIDEKIFTVGSPEVLVDSISTLSFTLGGIAGFDIFLVSNWGEEIRGVYADVEFRKGNDLLERTTTASVNLPGMARSRLQAYWDTSGMAAGSYDMIIHLNYLDKLKIEKHEIVLEANNIRVVGTGRVIEAPEEKDNMGVLILVIFMMVVLNGLLVYKFVIKKKQK